MPRHIETRAAVSPPAVNDKSHATATPRDAIAFFCRQMLIESCCASRLRTIRFSTRADTR